MAVDRLTGPDDFDAAVIRTASTPRPFDHSLMIRVVASPSSGAPARQTRRRGDGVVFQVDARHQVAGGLGEAAGDLADEAEADHADPRSWPELGQAKAVHRDAGDRCERGVGVGHLVGNRNGQQAGTSW